MVKVEQNGYPGLDIYHVIYPDGETHFKNYVLYCSMLGLATLCLVFRKKAAHIISLLGPALACYVQYRMMSTYMGDDTMATLVLPAAVSGITYVLFMAATSIMPYLPLSLMMSFTVMFLYYNVMAYLGKFETLFVALGGAAFGGAFLFSLIMYVGAGDMPWTCHRLIRRKGAVRSYFSAIMDCLSDVSMNIRAVKVPVPYVEVEPSYITRLYTMLTISGFLAMLITSGAFFLANVYEWRLNAFSVGLTVATDQAGRFGIWTITNILAQKDDELKRVVLMNGICWGVITLGIMFVRSTMFDGLMSLMFQAAQRRRGMYVEEKTGAVYASSVTTPTRVMDHSDMHDMQVVHRV